MAFSKRRSSVMLHLMKLFLTGRKGRKEVRKEGKGRVWEGRTRRRTKDGRADEGEGKGRRGSTRGGSDNH
jgi:hypothetical protein